jgi:hypothetical protein
VALDGQFELVFGTSAAAPVVGSMIAMFNDARLAIGKRPVGEFHGMPHEDKSLSFSPQASSIPQFTPLSLHKHLMILPLGRTQAVVCVLILGKARYTQPRASPQATDGFTAYVYAPVIRTY